MPQHSAAVEAMRGLTLVTKVLQRQQGGAQEMMASD